MPCRTPHPLVIAALALAVGCGGTKPPEPTPVASEPVAEKAPPPQPSDGYIADDGRTLWASPTSGGPIDPSLVPEGSGLFLHLRPSKLLASEEGRRVWRALGLGVAPPTLSGASSAGQPFDKMDVLTIGVGPGESYDTVATAVAVDPPPNGSAPLLPREVEQLLETTDRSCHATLVFSPRFLLGDGGSLVTGPWAPLRELLLAQTRDEWAAASLSLHIDDAERLYWELRVAANAAEPETRTAAAVAKAAQGWADDLARVVAAGRWSPYSAAIVERSPRMLAVVGKYARRGTDGRVAVVNGYAPPGSAHQLALAAERLISELAAPPAEALASAPPSALGDLPIAERLRAPVTVQFRRESLETAVTILSDALSTPIEILGRDLQLEGITRNQMLALDVKEKPAAEALLEVLRKANPDPLAKGANDKRQKLVYVVGDNGISITTRAAANRRGDTLPTAFQIE